MLVPGLYDGPFKPLLENLVFTVTQSSMMEPNRFTLALFASPTSTTFDPIPCLVSQRTSPPARIAIDTFGLIWRVPEYVSSLYVPLQSPRGLSPHRDGTLSNSPHASPQILPNVDTGLDATPYIYTAMLAFLPGRKKLQQQVKVNDGQIFTELPAEVVLAILMWGPFCECFHCGRSLVGL